MTDERKKPKQIGVFGKIETRDDALKIIKSASIAFLIIAAARVVISLYAAWRMIDPVDPGVLAEPILFVALCLIVLKSKSRIAAVLLLLIAATVIPAMLNISGGSIANLVVWLILLWTAIKSVEASFKLHARFAPKTLNV